MSSHARRSNPRVSSAVRLHVGGEDSNLFSKHLSHFSMFGLHLGSKRVTESKAALKNPLGGRLPTADEEQHSIKRERLPLHSKWEDDSTGREVD